ncbi:MAG: polymer-forming cytoskeletal protein [Spirochaetes bacterium]|nr:polymer-forming cytoskeletal protein [Spirochaetota bacterium]
MAKVSEEVATIEQGINTVLAPDIDFKGTLKFKTSLMIKGKFNGNIEADGHLVIGPDAKVEASIKADRITNYGEVIGSVEARDKLEMKAGAIQTGDIKVTDLIIDSGCKINGSCQMRAQGSTGKINNAQSGNSQ